MFVSSGFNLPCFVVGLLFAVKKGKQTKHWLHTSKRAYPISAVAISRSLMINELPLFSFRAN
jgi:hypothetical protein